MYFWGCQQEEPPTWQQGLSLEGGWAEPSCSLAGEEASNNHTEEQPEAITKARSKQPLINCYPTTPMSPRRATSQTKVGGDLIYSFRKSLTAILLNWAAPKEKGAPPSGIQFFSWISLLFLSR